MMKVLDADLERYIFNSSSRASYGKGLGGEWYMSDRELSSDAADVMDVVP